MPQFMAQGRAQVADYKLLPRFVIPATGIRPLVTVSFTLGIPSLLHNKKSLPKLRGEAAAPFTARVLLHGTTLISSWQGHSSRP